MIADIIQEGEPQFNFRKKVTYRCKKCGCVFRRIKGTYDNVCYDETVSYAEEYVNCPNCNNEIHIHPLYLRILSVILKIVGVLTAAGGFAALLAFAIKHSG